MTTATASLTANQIAAAKTVEARIIDALSGIDHYPLRGNPKYNLIEAATGICDRVEARHVLAEAVKSMVETGKFRFVRSGKNIVGITEAD